MDKSNLRPCTVRILKNPFKRLATEEEIHNGYFHIWGIESYIKSGYSVGTVAGQISSTFGIVEYEDGTVHRVAPECIKFTDREESQ